MNNNYYNMDGQRNKEVMEKQSGQGIHDKMLIEMIKTALTASEESAKVYKNLQNTLISDHDKNTAREIMLDNVKHCRQLGDIMRSVIGNLTEETRSPLVSEIPGVRITLPGFFEDRLYTELSVVELFRQIYFALIDLELRDILFDIIMDKHRHALCMCMMYSKFK